MTVKKGEQFGGKWWIDFTWRHPDGRRERIRRISPVQTKRGAETYEAQLRVALLEGTFGTQASGRDEAPVAQLVEAFAEQWMRDYVAVHNKPSEKESKRSILDNHLLPAFGKLRLDEVDQRRVAAFKARKLESGLSAKTINNQLATLKRMLAVAIEWNCVETIPTIRLLHVEEAEFDFFTFAEAERLLAGKPVKTAGRGRPSTVDDVMWARVIRVVLRTGLRIGELLALRWIDVDLRARKLNVRRSVARKMVTDPKSRKSREVPLSSDAIEALQDQRAASQLRSEYVFPRADGTIGSKEWAKQPLWRACRAAGLREVGWHVLRHTFASHLVMRGVSMKVVQELLGHSDVRTTMRYAHLAQSAKAAAVELLQDAAPEWAAEDEGNASRTAKAVAGQREKHAPGSARKKG